MNTSVRFGAGEQVALRGVSPWETSDFAAFGCCEETENGFFVNYLTESKTAKITEEVAFVGGTKCLIQRTRVTNTSEMPLALSRLASSTHFICGNPWEEGRFIVYTCINRWQGEAQWQARSLIGLGLYPATTHPWEKCVFRIASYGSQSTSEFYPIVVVEDKKLGMAYFFECEGSENRFIEINVYGGFVADGFTVTLGGADEETGFKKRLAAGESYISSPSVFGAVKGGFDDAIAELIRYKRLSSAVPAYPAVTFNDYMNCGWARPTREKLIPLIDAAANAGAEVFCIDDGWAKQGIWKPLDENFGEGRLKSVIDYILSKGMRAGLWFEFERTSYEAAPLIGDENYLLRRDGEIIAPHRPKLNLRCRAAVEFLLKAVDDVYKTGVRFIKNDHNNAELIGCNEAGESPAEGLKAQEKAFYDFITELHRRYPDLEIENCGSGAMRSDNGTLRLFSLQSTSDQEDYRLYPSIAVGSLALMPCEKAGIWSYPYPLTFDNIASGVIPQADLISFADGGQTEFNMVTAMVGRLYLSGRIDLCDDKNAALIREAIAVYKSYRDTLSSRHPQFPVGFKPITDRTHNAVVLAGETDAIAAVWGLNDTRVTIGLGKKYDTVEKLYPSHGYADVKLTDGKLDVKFDAPYRAVLVLLTSGEETK